MIPVDRYDYELPAELIAQQPLPARDRSRLMVVDRTSGTISHRTFSDLPEYLQPGDCLVLNDTRVLPAKLIGRRLATGGNWEGLFLQQGNDGLWQILSQTRGKLQRGERVGVEAPGTDAAALLELELVSRSEDGGWLARPLIDGTPEELLRRFGRVPLPPYIGRDAEHPGDDREQYQTVYARRPGAVAAPTAGLHFTPELLDRIVQQGVAVVSVTLHVGLGTFRPISSQHVEEHHMHSEWGRISADAAEQILECRRQAGRVVAVGTTSVRVLETAGRSGRLEAWSGQTDLYIRPPYKFQIVDAMITNFHLPRTSLLVLVGTMAGDALIQRAYKEAIRERYRFYSYGDAMLIV